MGWGGGCKIGGLPLPLSGILGLEMFAWVWGILGVPWSLGRALGLGFGFFCSVEVLVVL